MKRFLFLFFATLFALTTWAYDFVENNSTGTSIYYNIIDGGVEVTYRSSGSSSYSGEVTVPSTVTKNDVEYTVIGIGDDAFEYSKVTTLTLPNTIQHIGWSFYYSEVQEVVFLDGVTSLTLDSYAFQYATNLTSINLPSVLTAIPTGGFDNCTSLASIEIPAAVTSIGGNAFRRCPLTSVTCYATTPPTCQSTAFANVTTSDVTLYVPSGSVGAYKDDSVWGGFNVQAIDDGGDTGGSYTIVFSPANGGTETLPEGGLQDFITISCADGISMDQSKTWRLANNEVSDASVSVNKYTPSDDGTSITLHTATTITTAGTYSLQYNGGRGNWYSELPEGTFLLGPEGDQVDSGVTSYSFTLVEEDSGSDDPYTVEPDEDVVQQSLSYVKFIAEGAICYSEEIEASAVKVYKDEVEVASGARVVDDMPSTGAWDDAVNIYFDTTIVEKGDYKVVVPPGFMNLGSWTVTNDEITLYYTIDGSLDTGGGTGDDGDHEGDYLTPEIMGYDLLSENASSAQSITYSGAPSGTEYGAYTHVGVAGNTYEGDFNISNNKEYIWNSSSVGYLRKLIIEPDERSTDSRTLSVRASNAPYTGSTYNAFSSYGEEVGEISFPAGGTVELSDDYEYFVVSFGSNEYSSNIRFKSIEVVWEVADDTGGGSGDHEYSIDPDPDVEQSSLQKFTFTSYEGFVADEEGTTEYKGTVSIYKDGDSEPYAITSNIDSDWDSNINDVGDIYLFINFAEAITESGSYELVIPAGLFYWLDGEDLGSPNDEMRFSYIVTGKTSTGSGDHDGDYLTAENMGLTAGATSNETISFTGPSGTEYEVNARWISGGDYDGDINFYATGYLKNTTSVGNLSKVIFEPDANETSSTIFTVRASNEPWDGTNFTSYGDKVAEVAVNAGGTFEIEGEYAYFACYGGSSLTSYRFKSVEVVWNIAGGDDEEGAIPAGYILDPAHESYVETLSTISIYPESGSLSLNDYNAVGVVMSKTGGQVGTVTFSDDYDDELQMGWCIATLSEEISDMGTYYVTFPAGVFYNFGEGATNPEFTATYYVTGSADEGEYSFTPADGSTLTSLESFDVCHSISICCAWDQTLLITVEDENGNTVAYGADCVDNWPDSLDDPCLSCTITLNTKIVAAGKYTISIPAGYFVVGENDLLSEALTITYIVDGSEDPGTETGIGGISINDENVEGIYSTSGQKLNKAQKGVNIIRYTDGSVKKLYVK